MFSLQSNEKVSKYANFLQTKCMKKRLTRYFYDFKVAKGTVIYGESNKSANLMPSLQACGSALFGIESNFVEEHPNLVREYEEENDFDSTLAFRLTLFVFGVYMSNTSIVNQYKQEIFLHVNQIS